MIDSTLDLKVRGLNVSVKYVNCCTSYQRDLLIEAKTHVEPAKRFR